MNYVGTLYEFCMNLVRILKLSLHYPTLEIRNQVFLVSEARSTKRQNLVSLYVWSCPISLRINQFRSLTPKIGQNLAKTPPSIRKWAHLTHFQGPWLGLWGVFCPADTPNRRMTAVIRSSSGHFLRPSKISRISRQRWPFSIRLPSLGWVDVGCHPFNNLAIYTQGDVPSPLFECLFRFCNCVIQNQPMIHPRK